MLDAKFFEAMKPGAFFVNTSRGEVVEQPRPRGRDRREGAPGRASTSSRRSRRAAPGAFEDGDREAPRRHRDAPRRRLDGPGAERDRGRDRADRRRLRLDGRGPERRQPREPHAGDARPLRPAPRPRRRPRPRLRRPASAAGINVEQTENVVFAGAEAACARIQVGQAPQAGGARGDPARAARTCSRSRAAALRSSEPAAEPTVSGIMDADTHRDRTASRARLSLDYFRHAAASGKADLLVSKVGGAWTPLSAADVRGAHAGPRARPRAPRRRPGGPRRDPLGEPARVADDGLRDALPRRADRARSTRATSRRRSSTSSGTRSRRSSSSRARSSSRRSSTSATAARSSSTSIVLDHVPVERGQGRLRSRPWSRRASRPSRADSGGLRGTRVVRPPDRPRDDDLHVGHDGRAEGRDPDARELRVERRDLLDPLRRDAGHGRPVVPAALATCSSGWSTTSSSRAPTTIAYAESIDKLSENFGEVKPHCFAAVPRVYEKMLTRVQNAVDAAPALRRAIFAWGVSTGLRAPRGPSRRAKPPGFFLRLKYRARGPPRLREDQGAPRRAVPLRDLGRRAALARRRRVLLGGGRRGLRGLRPHGDEPRPRVQPSGRVAPRHGRPRRSRASRSRSPRTARSSRRVRTIMEGGYWRKKEETASVFDADGWFLTGDIGSFRPRRVPDAHGPQEGDPHQRVRQEHRAGADRGRAQGPCATSPRPS